jgi:hypothetical protein
LSVKFVLKLTSRRLHFNDVLLSNAELLLHIALVDYRLLEAENLSLLLAPELRVPFHLFIKLVHTLLETCTELVRFYSDGLSVIVALLGNLGKFGLSFV